jgi:hypothetical protein
MVVVNDGGKNVIKPVEEQLNFGLKTELSRSLDIVCCIFYNRVVRKLEFLNMSCSFQA